jgi:hypothetical protein
VVEVERTVYGSGQVGLASSHLNVGYQLAGQRVTLRTTGRKWRSSTTVARYCAPWPAQFPPAERHRLRGARRAASD